MSESGPSHSSETEVTPVLITREHAFRAAQNAVRLQGYAVALHGSQVKDLDLIAIPWQQTAITAESVARQIANAIPGNILGESESKPHGRVAWTIYPKWAYGFDRWYVDLSVMPRTHCETHEWGRWQDDPAGVIRTCHYCDAVDHRPEG